MSLNASHTQYTSHLAKSIEHAFPKSLPKKLHPNSVCIQWAIRPRGGVWAYGPPSRCNPSRKLCTSQTQILCAGIRDAARPQLLTLCSSGLVLCWAIDPSTAFDAPSRGLNRGSPQPVPLSSLLQAVPALVPRESHVSALATSRDGCVLAAAWQAGGVLALAADPSTAAAGLSSGTAL